MKQRSIRHISYSVLLSIITASCSSAAAEEQRTTPVGQQQWQQRFSEPISRADMVDFWAMLLSGYDSVLAEDKCWGDALPEMKRSHWLQAPEDRKGDPELVTRMLWGLGGWFSQPDRAETLTYKGKAIDVKRLMVDAVSNGTNPNHAGYWKHEYAGNRINANQFCVEAPPIGLAYQLANDEIKTHFSKADHDNLMKWLIPASTGHRQSNWNLFHALAATIRKKNGEEVDLDLLRKNLKSCSSWYYDDGVFSDGPARYFDDYMWWVFSTHLMLWYELDKEFMPEIAEELPNRMRAVIAHQPWYFGADGSHPEFGRSITYKVTRLASLIQAYRLGMTDIPAGQIRRIVRLHLGHYLNNGAIDAERCLLLQTLSSNGSGAMREGYNFPGSTYWAMMSMGEIWKLADNDPFWTTPEEPLPVERCDFRHVIETPGWILHGRKQTGSVNLINVGTVYPGYGSKYSKQAYHSQLGYVVSRFLQPCDHQATLLIDSRRYAPAVAKYDIDEENPKLVRQLQTYKEERGVALSHILYVDGETMLRITKIVTSETLATNAVIHQGGYPIGFTPPEKPELSRSKNIYSAHTGRYQTIYKNLLPDSCSLMMADKGYLGYQAHTREKSFVLPYAEVKLGPGKTHYIATVSYGSSAKVDPETFAKRFTLKDVNEKSATFSINSKECNCDFLE